MTSMKAQSRNNDDHSSVCDESWDEPAEAMLLHFHDFESNDRQGVSELQAIQDLCTKYSVNEHNTSVVAQSIIEDAISSTSRAA